MTTRPPCIVCGRRRGHDTEVHDHHNRERRRCVNLLRKTWPRLKGLPKLMAFYAAQEPSRPVSPPRPEWGCKVNPRTGEVTHHAVRTEEIQRVVQR